MRLLSDAFLCLSCSSIFLTCYLAYKPRGNRLSQSKFVQCLAEHGSLISQSICFIYHLNIGGFAFCAAFLLFPGLQQQHKPMQTEGQLSATAEGILKENSSEHPAIAISIQAMGDHTVLSTYFIAECSSECRKKPTHSMFRSSLFSSLVKKSI